MKSAISLSIVRNLIALVILAVCALPGGAQTPATWTSVTETSTPGPDYSQSQYWMMKPENPNAQPVDVLFFHTTTFKDLNYVDPATGALLTAPRDPAKPQVWNQTIDAAIQES